MFLIDHILRSNIFSLQHIVQRRRAILEALYFISEGFWLSPAELIMTSLFHFEDKVHRRNLTRIESTPLLFSRLLCQVLEHIDFLAEPRLERRRDCEAILIIDRWHTRPHYFHLPPPELAEDQLAANLPVEEQPPPAMHIEEPQVPASSVPNPASTAPLPTAPTSSAPLEPRPLVPQLLQMLLDRAPQHRHHSIFLYPLGISWSSWMQSAHSPPRLHHLRLPMQP